MKYKVNSNYFSSVEKQEQAYILGFIYADGYNRDDLLELLQIKPRIDILQKIKKELETEAPIVEYTPDKFTLNICSKKICEDLTDLGAPRAKSLILKFPTFIDKELMPHFIRGYFDGDGCIWDGKRKKTIVKDSACKTGYRERIVHNVKFTFTGNYNFINSLQDYLIQILGFKKIKLNFSKAKETKHICTMEYSGRGQIKRLYDYMYKDANIYCDEKYNKFNKIFCALDEKSSIETVLTEETPEMVIVNQASQSL